MQNRIDMTSAKNSTNQLCRSGFSQTMVRQENLYVHDHEVKSLHRSITISGAYATLRSRLSVSADQKQLYTSRRLVTKPKFLNQTFNVTFIYTSQPYNPCERLQNCLSDVEALLLSQKCNLWYRFSGSVNQPPLLYSRILRFSRKELRLTRICRLMNISFMPSGYTRTRSQLWKRVSNSMSHM